jgi:hypothetical protein
MKKFWSFLIKKLESKLILFHSHFFTNTNFVILKFPNFYFKNILNVNKRFCKTKCRKEIFIEGEIIFFQNQKVFLFLDNAKFNIEEIKFIKKKEIAKLSKKYDFFINFGFLSKLLIAIPDF